MQKNYKVGLAIAVTSFLPLVVLAQPHTPATEQELVAVDGQRMDALRRGDPSPLEQIYADDYTLVTGLGQVRSKADQIAELKSGRFLHSRCFCWRTSVDGPLPQPNSSRTRRRVACSKESSRQALTD